VVHGTGVRGFSDEGYTMEREGKQRIFRDIKSPSSINLSDPIFLSNSVSICLLFLNSFD